MLILDESVAALDVSIQAQILNLLMDIRDETAVSYVLISHDLAVVRQLTNQAIVMRKGQVVEQGPTAQILDAPTDPYTRLLRDSVPRQGWRPQRRSRSRFSDYSAVFIALESRRRISRTRTSFQPNEDAMTDLAYLSADDAIAAFADRSVSPVELLEALIDRIEASEPALNAVCDRRYDEARVEAKASEARYANGTARALEGLPVAAKEEQPMIGRSWEMGSLVLVGEVATEDHPVIERIQAAGGIVHIRTKTPEFSSAAFTESKLWGATRNPWNLNMTPGGSSGGSGTPLPPVAPLAPAATWWFDPYSRQFLD